MPTIGIDLGGTKCLGVVIDASGVVIDEHRLPTRLGNDGAIEVLAEVAAVLRARNDGVVGIGVGVPGLVDRTGVLRVAPNLAGVVDLDVRTELSARLAVPVVVENDATVACWGERVAGAAKGADDCVFVALGTGIGGSAVCAGRLFRGAHGYAGEFGHMTVDPAGPVCVCGQRGCWERYASGSGLAWLAREAAHAGRGGRIVEIAGGAIEAVRGEHVTLAASEGDAEAQAVMADFARWIGVGITNLVNAFDPAVVVLGGGLVEAGEVLFEPVRTALDELWFGAAARPMLSVVPAALGERAGSIGAALLAREPSSADGR